MHENIHKQSLLPSTVLILASVLFIVTVDNIKFWSLVSERLSLFSLSGLGYAVTFIALHAMIISLLLAVVAQGKLLKPIICFILILAATLGYFNQQLGVVFDSEMIRNVVETAQDRNWQEATELLSLPLAIHVVLYGLVPSLAVILFPVRRQHIFREQAGRLGFVVVAALITSSLVMMNFKYLTFFSRENNDLKVFINPLYPLSAATSYIDDRYSASRKEFVVLGQDATITQPRTNRVVGIMMVGETARADHFSLNGYSRQTNPKLEKRNLVNFDNAHSCGTSTAFSVPCMFSFLDQEEYSPERAAQQSNALDVLQKAGVKVVWIDNNSSCKGVCKRIESVNLRADMDTWSPHYSHGEYRDEILLDHVERYILNTDEDILLVMHMMGSHGPTYHKRFPESFAHFKPYCKSASPQECPTEEVINSYDNTIVYTDHVLDSLITKLEKLESSASTFLFYASDHGESLGENGVYLHGLPRFLAPASQTHIPMLAWFSDSYSKEFLSEPVDTSLQVSTMVSHDNLSSSLLSLYTVDSNLLKPDRVLFPQRELDLKISTAAVQRDKL